MVEHDVVALEIVDRTQVALVGGKGAPLGELSRISGVRVPVGFCVTTDAFLRMMAAAPSIDDHFDAQLDALSFLALTDREAISTRCATIRRTIEATALPDDLVAAITSALINVGEHAAYASAPARPPRICRQPRSRESRTRT